MEHTGFTIEGQGRSLRNLIGIISALGLLALLISIDAIWPVWLVAIIPAAIMAWEYLGNRYSRFTIDGRAISWVSGASEKTLPLADIDRVRILRRLDFSRTITIVDNQGQVHRIPQDCTPPVERLVKELDANNIPVSRAWFAIG